MWTHAITFDSSQSSYWHSQSVYSDTVLTDAGPASVGCSFVTLSWSRTAPTGLREDYATITLAIGGQFAGNLWAPLGSAEKASAEGHLDTYVNAIKGWIATPFVLKEYRWHDWHVSEDKLGPADRVTSKSIAGTGGSSARMPDQDAMSITLRTAGRKHWGRLYLPGIYQSGYDMAYGRFLQAHVDSQAGAFHSLMGNLSGSSFDLLVASRKYRAVLDVSELAVDDVVDIVRRRRAKQAGYHKVYTS